ncbi:MAG: helix-turn-helix domain-containing protein [Chloroflexi bacterium]|nr:helix-turn-helix domain-containing protein [Chloroflexota bacterium]
MSYNAHSAIELGPAMGKTDKNTEWYTVEEAASYLGVSRRTIYKLTREGRLPTYRLGEQRIRRFRRKDLESVPQRLPIEVSKHPTEAPAVLSGDPVLDELWNNDDDAIYDTL